MANLTWYYKAIESLEQDYADGEISKREYLDELHTLRQERDDYLAQMNKRQRYDEYDY